MLSGFGSGVRSSSTCYYIASPLSILQVGRFPSGTVSSSQESPSRMSKRTYSQPPSPPSRTYPNPTKPAPLKSSIHTALPRLQPAQPSLSPFPTQPSLTPTSPAQRPMHRCPPSPCSSPSGRRPSSPRGWIPVRASRSRR